MNKLSELVHYYTETFIHVLCHKNISLDNNSIHIETGLGSKRSDGTFLTFFLVEYFSFSLIIITGSAHFFLYVSTLTEL